jgi:hypothetical protein
MSILTIKNLQNFQNLHPHELKRLVRRAKAIMKTPLLCEEDISFLRLRMAVCRKDLCLAHQAMANLEILMERAAGNSFYYISTFPADDVLVATYYPLQLNIDEDSQQLQQDERELDAWLLRAELEKILPEFLEAWKAEKQRRYGSGFGSTVELGFDALDALETSEPYDFELVDVVVDVDVVDDVVVDDAGGWQLVF